MLARLLEALAPFSPTLVGTFPLGLQVEGSDLDVACACADLDAFERALRAALAELGAAASRIERLPLAPDAVVARLAWDGLAIEVFCQPQPVAAQAGFRHLVIEGQLLVLGGEPLRARVRDLKRAGVKTEPAFARVLGLDGDPYAALLALEGWPPPRLRRLVERALRPPAAPPAIAAHAGPRDELWPLFRLADDADAQIAAYLPLGAVLVARDGGALAGHVQMLEDAAPATWELKSLAVVEAHRHTGLGRRLVEAGVAHARARGARRVILSTGAADTALLRFYQQLGFRLTHIDPDIFTPAAGYPPDLFVDGIRLLDRAWLARALD